VVFVGMTLAVPALAAEAAPRPLSQAAAAKVAALPLAALAQTPDAAPVIAPAGDRPFLKTPKGRIAVALLAGAVGYTLYSFGHDRVQSPVK
jgi:hypothetical protein